MRGRVVRRWCRRRAAGGGGGATRSGEGRRGGERGGGGREGGGGGRRGGTVTVPRCTSVCGMHASPFICWWRAWRHCNACVRVTVSYTTRCHSACPCDKNVEARLNILSQRLAAYRAALLSLGEPGTMKSWMCSESCVFPKLYLVVKKKKYSQMYEWDVRMMLVLIRILIRSAIGCATSVHISWTESARNVARSSFPSS